MQKPYPTYKTSSLNWLSQLPEHWKISGLNLIFQENKEKNSQLREDTILSLSYGNIVIKNNQENFGLLPQSFETYQIIEPGYLILRLTDLQNDKRSLRVGMAKNRGIITSAYLALVGNKKVDPSFYYYLLHTLDIYKLFYSLGGGVRQSSDFTEVKKLKLLLPPLPEQTQIAAFLDHKCALIDTAIQKKNRLIELLKEQKQAIINRAVTRGLNSDIPMKDSNIEWLGEVPAHWEVRKLKRLCYRIGDGLHGTPEYDDNSRVFFINGNNLDEGVISISNKTRAVALSDFEKYDLSLRDGSVLISINGTVGNLAIYSGEDIVLGKSAAFLECRKSLYNRFLFYVFKSPELINDYLSNAESTTIKNISLEALRSTRLGLPSLNEQVEITKFLDTEIKKIDDAIEKIESEIRLIQEYKTALIAEAVTGKIDVRDWKPKSKFTNQFENVANL